jgi:hypothetical protein
MIPVMQRSCRVVVSQLLFEYAKKVDRSEEKMWFYKPLRYDTFIRKRTLEGKIEN